ncbi:MAG TPA: hypothetical protein VFJ58_06015 [Armatimonadota bacterium]|nr:hypothetical protein [Armatimonadota bacterium]
MRKQSISMIALITATVGATVALAAAGRIVYYHGAVMTRDSRQIEGRTYVPLADVVRALGGRIAAHADGLEIVTASEPAAATQPGAVAGGANEVRGTTGNVGDWFFDGLWRFRVSRMERTDEYHYRYSPTADSDKPAGANDELVVFDCTIKNGHKETEEPILTSHGLGTQSTALTDDQGQSYPPLGFDVRGGALIPGASKNFAVTFSVPKGATLKDLVFSLYGFANTKVSNVRVHLNNP